jgi:VHL beta domain
MKSIKTLKVFCLTGFLLFLAANSVFAQIFHPAEKDKSARSGNNKFETSIEFSNETGAPIKLFWLDSNGARVFFLQLTTRQSKDIRSYLGVPWLVTDERDNALEIYYTDAQPRFIQIKDSQLSANRRDDFYDEYDDPQTKIDTKPITICSGQEIPRGYLIIAAGSNWNCSGWTATGKNSYTIKRPSRTEAMTVCANQNIPRGFVITSASNSWDCSNWTATGTNAYTIKRPSETETICAVSDTPRRYVVTANTSNWNCPNWMATGTNAKTIKRVN